VRWGSTCPTHIMYSTLRTEEREEQGRIEEGSGRGDAGIGKREEERSEDEVAAGG